MEDKDINKIVRKIALMKSQSEINNTVAKFLMEQYFFKSIQGKKHIELYVYKDGIYIDGTAFVKGEAERILDGAKANAINEIIGKIQRSNFISRDEFNKVTPKYICLENGILNLETRELNPYSSDMIFLNKLPVFYNKDAKCPIFLRFIEESLNKEDSIITQEWFGYMLWREYYEKVALACLGPTNTGKTVLLNTMKNFLGIGNISSIVFQELIRDKFASSALFSKYANIDDELTSKSLNDVSKFKKLTGKSVFSCEYKFGDKFNFVNYAKIVCATNKMPHPEGTIEDPESYYNRWMPIMFENKVEEEDKNKNLDNEINCKEEMSGILNWSLDGLDRLRKNGKFSHLKNWYEVRKIMKRHGDSVSAFDQDCVVSGDKVYTKDEMYDYYVEYCKLNDFTQEPNKSEFGKKFHSEHAKHFNDGTGTGWKSCEVKPTIYGI